MQNGPQQNFSQPLQRVAIFDFDGTVMAGQSGALFTTYLFRHHLMSLPRALALGWWGARYKLHLPYRQSEARELVFGALLEHPSDEVDAIMRAFHDEVLLPRIRPMALKEVDRCHEQGIICLLVSATFDVIAQEAAQATGMDGFVATKMQRDASGAYTGEVDGAVIAGDEKYRAAVRWCDEHLGKGRWELARAYADHHTDEDLLARAEEPFAVCPGKTLRPVARRNGWQIVDWDA